jgi:hypothetical protein
MKPVLAKAGIRGRLIKFGMIIDMFNHGGNNKHVSFAEQSFSYFIYFSIFRI